MAAQKPAVGGQALIEGVMMRGAKTIAMAVRKPDGEIEVKTEPIKGISTTGWMKVPFVRGILTLFSSMAVGVRALTWSAEFFGEGEMEEPSRFEKWLQAKMGKRADDILIGMSMVFAVIMAFGLFGALPTFLISLLKGVISDPVILSGMEGVLKILMFIGYVVVISQMRDIRRVFQYHGAEHKAIYCYENNLDLTVENAKKFTTLHRRCGTSFVIIVLIISITVFSFVPWSSTLMRIGIKMLFLPIIGGLSYEVIRLAGKKDNALVRLISWPGLMMQKLTTKEPDDKMLEVALASLKATLAADEELAS